MNVTEYKTRRSKNLKPSRPTRADTAGANLSSSAVVLTALGTTLVSTHAAGVLEDAGNANPDFNFRYDAGLGGYIFNLRATGYAPGTYVLTFRVAGDPTTHTTQFRVAQ